MPKSGHRPALLLPAAALQFALLTAPLTAAAESALRLPAPEELGAYEAQTFDDEGRAVGTARVSVSPLEDDRLRLDLESKIRGGASMRASAELGRITSTDYRVLWQQSLSIDDQGRELDLLRVDHRARTASCTPDGGRGEARTIPLPQGDRVANIPMALLFGPLARGEQETTAFQVFLCGSSSGPRIVDMKAEVKHREALFASAAPSRLPAAKRLSDEPSRKPSKGFVEIVYRPDMMLVPNSMLPNFSFWLDSEGRYLAHELPLYSNGPEVVVAREGWTPTRLGRRRLSTPPAPWSPAASCALADRHPPVSGSARCRPARAPRPARSSRAARGSRSTTLPELRGCAARCSASRRSPAATGPESTGAGVGAVGAAGCAGAVRGAAARGAAAALLRALT